MKGKIGIGIAAIFAVIALLSGITAAGAGPMIGDVNSDGQVNVVDALFIQQYAVGLRELSPGEFIAADVNGDGVVNAVDALFISQQSVSPHFIDGVVVGQGQQVLEVGTAYSVMWNSAGVGSVTIALEKNGQYIKNLIWNLENNGDAVWTPDRSLQPGTGYQIRITDVNTGIPGLSKPFSVEPYPCGTTTTAAAESNWPKVELYPGSPSGALTGGSIDQSVAKFLVTNPGPKDISIQRLQISQIVVNGSIERLAKNGVPRVFRGSILLGTGTNWAVVAPASASVTSDVVFPTPFTIAAGQTLTLDVRIDTTALITGDMIQFTLDNMNWIVQEQQIASMEQYGIFNIPSNVLTFDQYPPGCDASGCG